ncbi:MAG: hypothetical protein DRR42_25410 [Gammaproteobacteria bacterium]|nr:MAG: hypothetical protein DRR42_25410 [Gammaproteobacteria bacterium]
MMKKAELAGTWVLEAFQRGGVDIEALTLSMPDEINVLLYQPEAIAPDSLNRLLIKCVELSNNPDFGLTMNERVDTSMFGVFGYLLLNSSTVEELLGYLERYYTIFYSSGTFFKIDIYSEIVNILYGVEHPGKVDTRHDTEWSLGFTPYYLESLLGDVGKPTSAHFTHSAPNDLRKLKSVFGHDLHFNQTENKVVYQKSILKYALSGTSPSLLKILRQEAEELLQECLECDSLEKRVRLQLFEGLERHKANGADIAEALNMTLSTFKRKLAQENISFKVIKESVKNNLCIKLLLSTELSIFEVSEKLGFSDQSSFSRFFVRCNEVTPQRFREKNQ